MHQQLYLLELRSTITGFNSNLSISKSYDRNKSAGASTFSAYIIERENERFFKSAPTARSPRDLSDDSRLAEKFVDFEEL